MAIGDVQVPSGSAHAAWGQGTASAAGSPRADEPVERKSQPGGPLEQATGRRIRVLLADDSSVVREGLARLLQLQADIEIVGQAVDGLEAVQMALQLQPDVVVMDVGMPLLSGIEATRRVHSQLPQVRIIGLSMHDEQETAAAMRDAGAAAYLTKTAPPSRLIAAIRLLKSARSLPKSLAIGSLPSRSRLENRLTSSQGLT
jgi:two-component system response regulator NreC